ncbi:nucleoside-diphosphate kinase [Puia sp. P3]|uniref:nucleoside-diphosphate kinase n=1 Tax=Puia sp. P3 TaxID=3423952 RepID=UPI003D66D856
MSNRTFTMIKPDAFSKGHSGAIIDKIISSGFRVVALKLTRLSKRKGRRVLCRSQRKEASTANWSIS